MPNIGGLPGQVIGDLSGVAESAVSQAVKAGGDIAKGTIEQVTSAPSAVGQQSFDKGEQSGAGSQAGQDAKRIAEKRRFEEVKGELAQYIERKRQLDQKIARDQMNEQQEKDQRKSVEKKQNESWARRLLGKVGRESHGEAMKGKD